MLGKRIFWLKLMLFFGSGFYVLAREEEGMLFQEIPIVVTASRYGQPISESPCSIYVVTEEDIRQSGATSIPDVLRMVPGLDVLTITLTDQNISPRGYNEHMSKQTLVMIDGRSVYTDSFGLVFWNLLPIELADIKRIEIIRGPGSSLYGANAFNGVVNIITKTPQEDKGSLAFLQGGTFQTYLGSLLNAGKKDKLSYKISLGGQGAKEWRKTRDKDGESWRGNSLLRYEIKDDTSLSFSAGRGSVWGSESASYTDFGTFIKNGSISYLRADYDYSNLKTRLWWRQEAIENAGIIDAQKVPWDINALDAEMQHNLSLGKLNKLIWGLNYRRNQLMKNDYIPKTEEDIASIFVQDEIKVVKKLTLFLGSRLDHHPITNYNFSPRGSFIYTLNENNIFRLTASKAYRNPSQLESYMDRVIFVPMPSALKVIPGAPSFFPVNLKGNSNLNPSTIESYEIAYQTGLRKPALFSLNFFYNRIDKFMRFGTTQFYGSNELFPGLPGGLLPKTSQFFNFGRANGYGGEVELSVLFVSWLRGVVNYSYQKYINLEDDPTTAQENEKNARDKTMPLHKINWGLRMNLTNISANLTANYVSGITRIRNLAGIEGKENVGGYIQVNSRIGYQINKRTELAVAAFNLFNDKHNEFPFGWGPSYPIADEIGRRITASVNYRF